MRMRKVLRELILVCFPSNPTKTASCAHDTQLYNTMYVTDLHDVFCREYILDLIFPRTLASAASLGAIIDHPSNIRRTFDGISMMSTILPAYTSAQGMAAEPIGPIIS